MTEGFTWSVSVTGVYNPVYIGSGAPTTSVGTPGQFCDNNGSCLLLAAKFCFGFIKELWW